MVPGQRISLLGDWLSLYYVQNTGTAFSMFEGNKWVTVFLTSILIIACIGFIISCLRKKTPAGRDLAMLVTVIVAGGAGNMIDRFSLGYVTDMISFRSFAVFNVADIFITCGCFITMIYILLKWKNGEDI